MKIVFLGSPACAIESLQALAQLCEHTEHRLVGIVSQPAAPVGRGKKLMAPPVAIWGKERAIPTLQPERASDPEFLRELRALHPDLAITAAYGQILNEEFLAIPKRGTINIHPSLLPKLRGATPVQSFLLTGEETTGVTILFTVKALDAGNIICQEDFLCSPEQTSEILLPILFRRGGEMLASALEKLNDPTFKGTPQDESAVTHCGKIKKLDGQVRWNDWDANELKNRYRAYTPWPGIYTFLGEKRINLEEMMFTPETSGLRPGQIAFRKIDKALHVGCRSGEIVVTRLKAAGGKSVDAASFWNGIKDKDEACFRDEP